MASVFAVGGDLPAGLLTVFGAALPRPSSWSHSPGMDSSETADVGAAFPRRYFSQTSMAKLEAGAHAPEELRDSQMQLA